MTVSPGFPVVPVAVGLIHEGVPVIRRVAQAEPEPQLQIFALMGVQIFRIAVLDQSLDGIGKLRLVIRRDGIVVHGPIQQIDLLLRKLPPFIYHPGDLLGGDGEGFRKGGLRHAEGVIDGPLDAQGKRRRKEQPRKQELPFPPQTEYQKGKG